MEAAASLRERRRSRTRAEIVRVAMQLFRRDGYESAPVESIAAGAMISARTFYRYFPSKEELVFQGFPYSVELLRRQVTGGEGDLFERLLRGSLALASILERHRDAWIDRFELILSVPALRARYGVQNEGYEQVFREAMHATWGGGDDRIELLAGALMGGVQAAIRRWVRGRGAESLVGLTALFFESLRPAFPSPKVSAPPRVARPRPAKPHRRRSVELDFLD